jgi:hypothetical protein
MIVKRRSKQRESMRGEARSFRLLGLAVVTVATVGIIVAITIVVIAIAIAIIAFPVVATAVPVVATVDFTPVDG